MGDFDGSTAEFGRHTGRPDGQQVVAGLRAGWGLLSDLLYLRLHEDVEKAIGIDSMLAPLSETKSQSITKTEIGLYQIAESAATIRQFGYLPAGDDWCVPWLARLRLGESSEDRAHQHRIEGYLAKTAQARGLVWTDVLATVLPESRRAPLVLFLLFPLAVRIVTALAFGDQAGAKGFRASQVELLPVISGCRRCGGRVLENGQSCDNCANPLWKTEWLTSAE